MLLAASPLPLTTTPSPKVCSHTEAKGFLLKQVKSCHVSTSKSCHGSHFVCSSLRWPIWPVCSVSASLLDLSPLLTVLWLAWTHCCSSNTPVMLLPQGLFKCATPTPPTIPIPTLLFYVSPLLVLITNCDGLFYVSTSLGHGMPTYSGKHYFWVCL